MRVDPGYGGTVRDPAVRGGLETAHHASSMRPFRGGPPLIRVASSMDRIAVVGSPSQPTVTPCKRVIDEVPVTGSGDAHRELSGMARQPSTSSTVEKLGVGATPASSAQRV